MLSRTDLHPTIALLQNSSLTSVVQQEIERAILEGEFAPGAKLTEAAWAERLGVSRGPVREAFRLLEEAGLVRQEKNRGAFVRLVPMAEAMEIFDLRLMMDEWVGRHLARHITPEQLKALKAKVDAMERLAKPAGKPAAKGGEKTSDKAARKANGEDYALLNLEFHDAMVEFTGNARLTAMYRKLMNELSLFRRMNLADGTAAPTSANEHRAILKAIAAGDEDGAAAALRAHVQASKERTLRNHATATPPVATSLLRKA